MATTNKPADKKVTAEVKATAPKAEAKKEVKAAAPKAEAKKEVKAEAPKAEAKKVEAPKAEAKKPAAKKAAAPKAEKKPAAKKPVAKKAAAPKAVVATFESIYTAVEAKAKKAKFTSDFLATQITLKGNLECQPLYVKVEAKKAEVAPYEYNNACFYIDADAEIFAAILNGKKSIFDALAAGSVEINGDATKAILFVKAMF